MGFRTALHPMADLATEPRWARNFGTFGSNADLSSEMTVAYIKGFQGEEINENCESIINLAIKNGYKYCDRLHIRVWDNKRGV